jgi:ribosomal protein S18 acetylase RimI-like enzyme
MGIDVPDDENPHPIDRSNGWKKGKMSEDYAVSTDKGKLNIQIIHQCLSERSYWAKGRSFETVRRSFENSLCFGVYAKNNVMAGFARVVTDKAVFAYVMDVFILEEYRGRGLGKRLMESVMNHPELRNIKKWQLATNDAHALYEKYGFGKLEAPEKHMERVDKRCP